MQITIQFPESELELDFTKVVAVEQVNALSPSLIFYLQGGFTFNVPGWDLKRWNGLKSSIVNQMKLQKGIVL